jgi:4-hydroxybenzoate polyprenyltransferase
MKTYLRQVVEFILFSQLFIAAGAAAQTAFTYQLIGQAINFRVVALVFFATLALYNLSMVLSNPGKKTASLLKRVQWLSKHQHLCSSFTLIGGLSTLCLSLFLSAAAQIVLASLALISIAYSLPLVPFKRERVSLRNIPGLKLVLITLVWALSTTLMPIIDNLTNLSVNTVGMLLAHRILFFIAVAIPFDVRDIYQDSIYSLKTIAVALGKQKSQYVAHLSLALSSAIWWHLSTYSIGLLVPIILVFGVGTWCIQTADKQKELFYFVVLDGLLYLAPGLLALYTIA